MNSSITQWWEALPADPLPRLLGATAGMAWRTLVDLLRRPPESPAVRRLQGRADVEEPIAALMAPLDPDGSWRLPGPTWSPGGAGWRLVALSQLGADPGDPRLEAGMERLLEARELPDGWDGGGPAVPRCTLARLVEAAAAFGWERHPVVAEILARLAEAPGDGGWACGVPGHEGGCPVTAVALLAAAGWAARLGRHPAVRRALAVLRRELPRLSEAPGSPNLDTTDLPEACMVLARAQTSADSTLRPACLRLQASLGPDALPAEIASPPAALGGLAAAAAAESALWGAFKAAVALSWFAVPLALPRRFPAQPQAPHPRQG